MLLDIQLMRPDDYVGFTFFIGYMAMFAASVFFFFERSRVDDNEFILTCIGFNTGIAVVHYLYMRDYCVHQESQLSLDILTGL